MFISLLFKQHVDLNILNAKRNRTFQHFERQAEDNKIVKIEIRGSMAYFCLFCKTLGRNATLFTLVSFYYNCRFQLCIKTTAQQAKTHCVQYLLTFSIYIFCNVICSKPLLHRSICLQTILELKSREKSMQTGTCLLQVERIPFSLYCCQGKKLTVSVRLPLTQFSTTL